MTYNQPLVQGQNSYQSYDYKNIQYQEISPDQWYNVPCQQTDYSSYWATPDSFQPQTFSQNTRSESKWNDFGWNIAFWINFLITLVLFAYLSTKPINSDYSINGGSNSSAILLDNSTNSTTFNINTKNILSCVGVGVGVGIVLNILHLVYAFFAPVFYVHAGLIMDLLLSVIVTGILIYICKIYLFLIFPVFMFIFALCWYCIARKYIKISAAILKVSIKIVLKYPATIGVLLLQGIFSTVITGFFCYLVFLVIATEITPYILIYFALSYLWISLCFGYVAYMTVAGVASSWYFLNDTEYMPKNPTGASFKRAMTTSFGSASEAAFILAVIQLLRTLAEMDTTSSSDNGIATLVICCLKCIAICILSCLERIFGILNRYALIYCATYGIPYIEGCKRVIENFVTKFIDVLLSSCVISQVCAFALITFTVIGGFAGYGLGYVVSNKSSAYALWGCVFSVVFTLCLFVIFMQPMIVTADTLLVCYSENPERLLTTAAELAEELKNTYRDQLRDKISKKNKK